MDFFLKDHKIIWKVNCDKIFVDKLKKKLELPTKS